MGVALMLLCTAAVFTAAPAFHVVELGNGSPVDVNSSGTVIGVDGSSLTARPWAVDSGVRTYLPLPPGATSALVSRVSNTDVVVGHVNGQPLLWTKESGTYTVRVLPLPTGATGGLPVAVNASGDVLINYGTPTIYNGYPYFSSARPFLSTASGQLVDLARQYGLADSPSVTDMTDGGRILTSFGMILEPDLATTTPAPAPPAVAVISPGRNETVSGIVKVLARATDNVGVVRMELSDSRGVLLKTVNAAELTSDWNTAGLKKGSTQTLLVRAHDARGNVGSAKVSVRIQR
jgi:hypothetical protein